MVYKLFAARLEGNILGWEQNCWVWVENEEDPEDRVLGYIKSRDRRSQALGHSDYYGLGQ